MTGRADPVADVRAAALPRPSGRRSTRQQRALTELLASCEEFRSAQDLHAQLRAGGTPVGLATVYNHLHALAESGTVDTVRAEDGETLFRDCRSHHHHHHLVCRTCGRTVEVAAPAVEQWADHVAAAEGFVDVGHTVEIVGTCGPCAKRRAVSC
jgi:Fur family transcriptional regulator, ferric uptake regulator